MSEAGMQFDCPCTLAVQSTSSEVPSIEELIRYECYFGNLTVAPQRITARSGIIPDLDVRAKGKAEKPTSVEDGPRSHRIVPMTVSGLPARRVSISTHFKGKPVSREILIVVRGQTIFELNIIHEREQKQIDAAERMIRTFKISG